MQQENIIVNSCELTPVYLIPSTSVTQAGSYIITKNSQDVQNLGADNLKTFYENSGNLESGILSNPKPRILKKINSSSVGNNLKLASFLLPKTDSVNVQNIASLPSISKKLIAPVNNVIMKPAITAIPISSVNTVAESEDGGPPTKPLVEIDRKIIRVGTIPNIKRKNHFPKVLPKNKPNEKQDPNVTKHTSVQLIKLGETYHSLNQLSAEQLKIVNKALKMFSNKEQELEEPAYDPVTNTKFIYKVVSPKDLAVVGKNKVMVKRKNEIQEQKDLYTEELKKNESGSASGMKKKTQLKNRKELTNICYTKEPVESEADMVMKKKNVLKKQKKMFTDELEAADTEEAVAIKRKNGIKKQKHTEESEDPEREEIECSLPKVTRSGRTVRLPKHVRPGLSPQKPKKKVGNITNCFQCSAEFCSFYRLTRHYEKYPTHIPARIHSNLFHCLLAIIKGGSEHDQANIFVQQLEQLVEKLKSLWPCLLKEMDRTDSKLCTIGDNVCKLFGINPGKYSLNIDALNCVKDKDGHCIHNPAPKPNVDDSISTHTLSSKQKEYIINNEADNQDCARINSVDKWPTVAKRILKLKQQKENFNAKKIRLTSENDQPIEPGTEELIMLAEPSEVIQIEKDDGLELTECAIPARQQISPEKPAVENKIVKPKTQTKFHSAHFDIRSSPIKLPSSLVRRFQLNPDKACNFEVQIMRPVAHDKETVDTRKQSDCDLQHILNSVQLPKETKINTDISFQTAKEWSMSSTNDISEDDYIKTDLLFESGLTPEKNSTLIETSLLNVNDKQNYLLETPNKTINQTILGIENKRNNFIQHDFLDGNGEGNKSFESNQRLMNVKDEPNRFFDHRKTKCNSLIGSTVISINKDKTFESALSHVKDRSNNLFDTSLLQTTNKSDDNLFNHKAETDSLFESSIIGTIDKVLVGTPVLQEDNSNLFSSTISQRKRDGLLNQDLDDKLNCFGDSFKVKCPVSIDFSANDSRLMSNQGQSMLNYLDPLSSESLGLGYPETENRNNSVDFHLDLFAFNTS